MKTLKFMLLSVAILFFSFLMIDVIRFPEVYGTTLKYQLKNDLENGEPEALEYYNTTYLKYNKILFD